MKIRPAVRSDSAACGKLIAGTFADLSRRHGFTALLDEPCATTLAARMLDHPEMYGLVAEAGNRIAGTVFLDERAIVRGVGWLAVAPEFQGRGIARLMMNEVIERSLTSPGMRAVLNAKSSSAIGLLTSLHFEMKEPLALLRGRLNDAARTDIAVRPLSSDDIGACATLSEQAHGFARESELRDVIQNGSALVAARDGRINAYTSGLNSWPCGHAVAASEEGLTELILAAGSGERDLAFLIPTRQDDLLRWCLSRGLRSEQPMLLMSLGEYQDPACPWLPSAMF